MSDFLEVCDDDDVKRLSYVSFSKYWPAYWVWDGASWNHCSPHCNHCSPHCNHCSPHCNKEMVIGLHWICFISWCVSSHFGLFFTFFWLVCILLCSRVLFLKISAAESARRLAGHLMCCVDSWTCCLQRGSTSCGSRLPQTRLLPMAARSASQCTAVKVTGRTLSSLVQRNRITPLSQGTLMSLRWVVTGDDNTVERWVVTVDDNTVERWVVTGDDNPLERWVVIGDDNTLERWVVTGDDNPLERWVVIGDDNPLERWVVTGDDNPLERWVVIGDDNTLERWVVTGDDNPLERWVVIGDDNTLERWVVTGDDNPLERWVVIGDDNTLERWVVIGDDNPLERWVVTGDNNALEKWVVTGDDSREVSDDDNSQRSEWLW